MNNRTRLQGFTIVELLIVIVVIAILAAITIVSYNGIVARAENTKRLAAVDAWTKTLLLYKAEKGVLPNASPTNASANYCLGGNFPETNDFPEGKCIYATDTSYTIPDPTLGFTSNSSLNTMIQSTVSIPPTEFPTLVVTSGTFTLKERGLLYLVNPGSLSATLFYDTAGDVDCARGQKISNPGYTRCAVTIE